MRINKKAIALIEFGLKSKTVSNLTESEINTLYNKLILPEQSSVSDNLLAMNQQLSDTSKNIADLKTGIEDLKNELGEDDMAADIDFDLTGISQDKHQSMGDDGMDDDSNPNSPAHSEEGQTESEIKEKFVSKAQAKYFYAMADKPGKEGKEFKKYAKEFTKDTMKKGGFSKLPEKVTEENVRNIENNILSLLEKHLPKTITKKDIMNILEDDTKTAPDRTKTKPGTKPGKSNPFKPQPGQQPKPKAGDTKTAPDRTKTKPGTKPGKSNPFKPQPGQQPKPKAEVPEFLKFDNIFGHGKNSKK